MQAESPEIIAAVLQTLKPKEHRRLWPQREALLGQIHGAHLSYLNSTAEERYDEDDAFEAVYEAVLAAVPNEDDEDLALANLINAYFEALDDFD